MVKVTVEDKTIGQNDVTDHERKIISTANSMGILRLQVAKHIGIERMDSFLFQFGWEMGRSDGKELLKAYDSLEQLVIDGPIKHIASGHIGGVDHRCDIEYNEDGTLKTLTGRGEWFDSYEVEQHLNHFGYSETPVCHTLAGYSSGFMSTIFNKPLIAKEITCAAQGHETCQWMVRPQESWGDYVDQDVTELLNSTPIIEELEYTYDNLLEQTEFITRLSDFQKNLTSEVVNGRSIQSIVDTAGQLIDMPLTIENLAMENIASYGLSEIDDARFKEEWEKSTTDFLIEDRNDFSLKTQEKVYKLESHTRIIVPVVVQKQVLGYCSAIIDGKGTDDYEEEYLYLEHLASAAALIMLNEKAAFESAGRMKGSYLDQILNKELTEAELLKRGKYIGVDFTKNYRVLSLNYEKEFSSLEDEFNFQEKLLDLTYQYFQSKGQQVLTGFKDDRMVIMVFEPEDMDAAIRGFRKYIAEYLEKFDFKIGLGGTKSTIENAVKGYEEARIALRLAIRKDCVSYEDLGIVGVLINPNNIESIQIAAKENLKELYHVEEEKTHELFETLFYFLNNGGNLKNTASDLMLSMSGLRHRIQRIEDILQKDLRDPEVSNNLLLIMKALIVLKEVNLR